MKLKQPFQSIRPWLRDGLRGVAVCIALGIFYIAIYFPMAIFFKVGDAALILPTLTGHTFVVIFQWIIPCHSCGSTFNFLKLVMMAGLLLLIYFLIGAVIGHMLAKRRRMNLPHSTLAKRFLVRWNANSKQEIQLNGNHEGMQLRLRKVAETCYELDLCYSEIIQKRWRKTGKMNAEIKKMTATEDTKLKKFIKTLGAQIEEDQD